MFGYAEKGSKLGIKDCIDLHDNKPLTLGQAILVHFPKQSIGDCTIVNWLR